MTQDQLLLLLFKVSTVSVELATLAFILTYTKLAPWWRSIIGRTIVWKDIALLLAFIPTTLSLFLQFSRLSSRIAAWIDIADFFVIAGIMLWRIRIWIRTHKEGTSGIQ